MPQVGLVDAMEDEVGESDGEDHVLLLAAKERVLLEEVDALGRSTRGMVMHVLVCLSQESTGAATRVVHHFAHAWLNRLHHRADDLARRKELATIIALLAHLQQQAFIAVSYT